MFENEVKSGILDYVFGGRSEFYVFQEPSSKFWFYVKKAKYKGVYFVSGSRESVRNMRYLGTMTCEISDCQIRPLRYKLAKDADANSEFLMKGLLNVLMKGDNQNPRVHIIHNGRCSVCGRLLTDSESVQRGIGPTCIKKAMRF